MPILQLLSVAFALLLGIVVVLRNTTDKNRWLLLCFNGVVSIWILSYIFADTPGDGSLYWNRFIFVSALLIVFVGYVLIMSLANRLRLQKLILPGIVVLAWAAVGLLTPFIVQDTTVRIGDNGAAIGLDVVRGVGYPFYVATIAAAGFWLVGYVYYLSRKSRARFRAQLTVIFAGFASMLVMGLLLGVVLPIAAGSSAPANLTFLVLFIAIGVFTYAIVRQRLFDIRLAIARSLGYFLALAVVGLFYIGAIFSLADVIFAGRPDAKGILRASYVVVALFSAVTFWPLQRYFSRLTNRIFFRDTYSIDDVLSRLTASLVGAVDLNVLTRRASSILQHALKVDSLRIVTVQHNSEYDALIKSVKTLNQQLVITDELNSHHKHISDKLYESKVALVARLQTHQELVGYLVCGHKTRGDALTNQDVDLLRVASGELAVAVQNALRFEEIAQFNHKLKQEIAEATAQLRDSNKKLKKLDEAKDEFISMASHQLRTPLTSVKGYLSMVLDGDAGRLSSQQQRLLQEAFTASQRMVYLISDFLNVSRLQTGRFELEPRPTNLARIIEDEVAQLHNTAVRRNVAVNYNRPSGFPVLRLDETKIRQVIMNFIDNAIYYSKPDGVVEIVLLHTGSEVRLEVHDKGIGVPEQDRHKVFTKFFRAENARKIRPDGTGIGLFMAKKVITAHGGSIIFNTKMGRGSVFGFMLPVKKLDVEQTR